MIEHVPVTGSTNADLLARLAAAEFVPEGLWLVADRQQAGRGRSGRQWFDGAGNFMGSTVGHLRPGDPPAPTLALVAGLAAHRAVGRTVRGLSGLLLKWPNDLLLGGAKLAGILCERQGDAVVVGLGVNLAAAPEVPGRETVSLAAAGHPVGRDGFADAIGDEWATLLHRWHAGEWSTLRTEWTARALPAGTALTVHEPGGTVIEGRFAGLDPDGAALLDLASGTRRAIHAGDIELVRNHAPGG